MMRDHNCCYDQCLEEGMIPIGVNGGDSHWICWRHLNRWNQTRARLISDGGGCAMQELGELTKVANEAQVESVTNPNS